MALPTSRNTTYAATDPVKSADLNDIQDQIIADSADKDYTLPIIKGVAATGTYTVSTIGVGTLGTGSQVILIPIDDLQVGARIRSAFVTVNANIASDTVTVELMRRGSGSAIASNTGTAAAKISLSSIDHTVLADDAYYLRVSVTVTTSVALDHAGYTLDRNP